ncbi:pilus assembly protein PilO [Candidatus Pelagibacter bacterium nBUS_36]|uniref:pilus assembly protein PilO n=1 Tax=Candidatus Pelagibacter bacterium nBUS_36 TaxID=3374194 RepID=UPI003EBB4E48
MDLGSLKNMDLNDLMSKLKSGGLGDKKNLIKFGIGFFAVLVFLIGYYVFVSPKIKIQEEQIMLMEENKNKILEFNNNIITVKKSIKKLEPEYKKNSKLFHSKKEVEDLYQNISKFALLNGLSIISLTKGEPKAVSNSGASEQNSNNSDQNTSTENPSDQNTSTENPEGQQVMYYKIPVDYEIQGNFLSYLKFRRALSKSQKVINFDKEEITTIAEMQGQILSKVTLSIVGLPDEYK